MGLPIPRLQSAVRAGRSSAGRRGRGAPVSEKLCGRLPLPPSVRHDARGLGSPVTPASFLPSFVYYEGSESCVGKDARFRQQAEPGCATGQRPGEGGPRSPPQPLCSALGQPGEAGASLRLVVEGATPRWGRPLPLSLNAPRGPCLGTAHASSSQFRNRKACGVKWVLCRGVLCGAWGEGVKARSFLFAPAPCRWLASSGPSPSPRNWGWAHHAVGGLSGRASPVGRGTFRSPQRWPLSRGPGRDGS